MLNAVWKQDDVGLMSKIVAGTLTAALLVTGGYVWADINDLVPGFLTNAEPIPPALPFPTVTGPDPATSPADPLPILDGKGAPITGDTIATLAAKLAKNKDGWKTEEEDVRDDLVPLAEFDEYFKNLIYTWARSAVFYGVGSYA